MKKQTNPALRGFLWFSAERLQQKDFLSQLLRKIRRAYVGLFHRKYVQEQIAQNRVGECHRCGACCKLIYRCPFLGHDAENLPYCRIYGEFRPWACKNYPFDAVDSEVDQCGFRFKS